MAVKTVNLSKDAYERLAALKKGSESFSEVVNRITGKYRLRELIGILSNSEAEEMRKAAKEVSESLRKEGERVAKRMLK